MTHGRMYLYTARVLERDVPEDVRFYDVEGNQASRDGTDLSEIRIQENMVRWLARDFGLLAEDLIVTRFTFVSDPEERNPSCETPPN